MKKHLSQKALRRRIVVQYLLMALLILPIWYFAADQTAAYRAHAGSVIVIDVGHGGVDGGAFKGDLLEKDINLKIGLILRRVLEQRGYTVVMTRDTDIALDHLNQSSASRHTRDLNARVDIINAGGARCFVSIHVNSNPRDPAENGSSVFYRSRLPEAKILASCIQEELNLLSAARGRKTHAPQPGRYYILGNSKIPGVIIESGFITNSDDRRLLTSEDFLRQLACAIADGLDRYTAKAVT